MRLHFGEGGEGGIGKADFGWAVWEMWDGEEEGFGGSFLLSMVLLVIEALLWCGYSYWERFEMGFSRRGGGERGEGF